MSLIEAVILGIVQGITEFLPISSSGHLVLFQHLFNIQEQTLTFDVALHLGTLVPVFIVFWRDIWGLVRHPLQNGRLWLALIIGTLPTVVVALLFESAIESLFQGTLFLAFGFTLTGVLLVCADRVKGGEKAVGNMKMTDALAVGLIQAVAIAPSISRSGSTVSMSLFRGMKREDAARYSFLLSIPAVGGAVALQAVKLIRHGADGGVGAMAMVVGGLFAAAAGFVSIRFMLALIKRAKLKYFAVYVFALAALILVDVFVLRGAIFS